MRIADDWNTYYADEFDNPNYELLERGYIGQEHLPNFGLINLNARLYDPLLGRFLSCDNYVQNPGSAQNYNRYSYCFNNPLTNTDANGNFIFSTFLGPFGAMIDAACWAAVIDVGVQAVKIASGMRQNFSWSELGGTFAGAFVGASMGLYSSEAIFGETKDLLTKYIYKALWSSSIAAVSAGVGAKVSSYLNDENMTNDQFWNTVSQSVFTAFGISVINSTYNYFDWDQYTPEQKIAILQKYHPDVTMVSVSSHKAAYAYTYWNRDDKIYFGELSLEGRAIAENSLEHEYSHILDYRAYPGLVYTLANHYASEYRAHLLDLNLTSSQLLPYRYWFESKNILFWNYHYSGSIPNSLRWHNILFNIIN